MAAIVGTAVGCALGATVACEVSCSPVLGISTDTVSTNGASVGDDAVACVAVGTAARANIARMPLDAAKPKDAMQTRATPATPNAIHPDLAHAVLVLALWPATSDSFSRFSRARRSASAFAASIRSS